MKKYLTAIFLIIGFVAAAPLVGNAADTENASCTIIIDSSKNTNINNASTATGECKDQVVGYYSSNEYTYNLEGAINSTVTNNGQIFEIGLSSNEYAKANLTVYTQPAKDEAKFNSEKELSTLYKLRIIKDNSAIYISDSDSSEIYKHLNLNDIVEVVEQKGTWYKIKDGISYGWIEGQYVSTDLTPEEEVILYKLRVTKNNSAVHTSDSDSSETYKYLNLNDIVEVVEQKGTWYKIKNGTSYGWIEGQYVSTDLTPEEKVLSSLSVENYKVTANSTQEKILYQLRVIKDDAAVHISDSGSSETYKHLNLNDIVEVVEQKGTWYKIKDGSTYGWIWNEYVSSDLTPEKILYKLMVTKDDAAVHISDSGSSETYKHLNLNDIVEVVEQKGTWYKIKDGTTYGWIWNQYVSSDLTPILYKLRITKNDAAVHTSDSGSSETYKHLNLNDIVEVVEQKGTWYKIKDGTTYGWIWNEYVSSDLTPEKILYKLRVTKSEAAVHISDSGSSETYKHLKFNDIVEVVDQKGTWYKIKEGTTYGWIWNQYVTTDLNPVTYITVRKDNAAVHTSDSGSSETIAHLKLDYIVKVVEQKGTWYKIKDGSTTGWIWNKYVSNDIESYWILYQLRVTKDNAAIHRSDSGSSETFMHVKSNDIVDVVEQKGNWYHLRINSTYGWIWNKYVSTDLPVGKVTDYSGPLYNDKSYLSYYELGSSTSNIKIISNSSDGWTKVKTDFGSRWINIVGYDLKLNQTMTLYSTYYSRDKLETINKGETVRVLYEPTTYLIEGGGLKVETKSGKIGAIFPDLENVSKLEFIKINSQLQAYELPFLFTSNDKYDKPVGIVDAGTYQVLEKKANGWVKIWDDHDVKWIAPNNITYTLTGNTKVYSKPSFAYATNKTLPAGKIAIFDDAPGGWVRVSNNSSNDWINISGNKYDLQIITNTYSSASLKSVTGEISPQEVTVLEETKDGFKKIKTNKGEIHWIAPYGKKVTTKNDLVVYKENSFTSTRLEGIEPQIINVIEEGSNNWLKILFVGGAGWVNINGEDYELKKEVNMYSEPNDFGSKINNSTLIPQTLKKLDDLGNGWIKVKNSKGQFWIAPNGVKYVAKSNLDIYKTPKWIGGEKEGILKKDQL